MAGAYLRFPDVRGELLAFVAEDDVWVAALDPDGERIRARRLSSDGVPVARPRFSADGSTVAWTSRRDGDPEVYTAPVEGGGPATRLTYWGAPVAEVCGWTPAGEVLAVSSVAQPFSHLTWAYEIPLDGTPPRRLPFGPVDDLGLTAETTVLLSGGSGRMEPARWKHYRGGQTGRLWTGGADGEMTRILADLDAHLDSPMIVGGRIAFLSDHEGTANLHSCLPDGSDLRRHTAHDDFYVRHASTDGTRVVYQVLGEPWILDSLDAEPRRLDVDLGGTRAARRPRIVTAAHRVDSLSCDKEGRASAVAVCGTVHWLTHRDGPARTLASSPTARARLPRVLGDTGQVVWVTDAGGATALEIAPAAGLDPGAEPRRIALEGVDAVCETAAAPDGSTVAVAVRDGRLLLVNVASGDVHELAVSDDGPVDGLTYAPDSAWLAWSHPGTLPLCGIRLARLDDRSVSDVTNARFEDADPVFTLDGKYLAFLSWRGFDPVYDSHFFDLSFPFGCRPYLVPLAADTPSPFAPYTDGRPVGDGEDGKDKDKERKDEPASVVVELEGLAERVVPFPVEEGRYHGLRAVKGGVAWLKRPLSTVLGESGAALDSERPRPSLHRFDLARRSVEELAGSVSWFEVSGDGNRIVVGDRGRLRVMPATHRSSSSSSSDDDDDDDTFTVDLSRVRVTLDPAAQWRHAYAEAGRFMRHDFWRPDMGGLDWDGILDAYRPALERIAGGDDFADLLWEVFGELRTSHAFVESRGFGWHGDRVGLLGADLAPDADGRWRVTRVLPGESSDPRARSPLTGPGAAVRPGDAIVAVDGRPVDPATGPAPLLLGSAAKPTELTVLPRGGGDLRRVAIVPLGDDQRLRYQDWVADRRRHVRGASDGRLGYLHIPDMMGEGWAQFHRDLRTEMLSEGLVLDLRANGGGHVSQLVVEKLARRVLGWSVPRGMRPSTYPVDAPRGPVVAVVDEHAGSDGDVISVAIQSLGLGPVVGTRTWGGVVGIDMPGHELVDGTTIYVPRYAFWFEGKGWDVENHGADPDVEVVPTPADWAADADPQLDTAVRLALEALTATPAVTPPTPPTGT